jgi:hypothetical protein
LLVIRGKVSSPVHRLILPLSSVDSFFSKPQKNKEFMNDADEHFSGIITYIPSLIKIGSGTQELAGWTHRHADIMAVTSVYVLPKIN